MYELKCPSCEHVTRSSFVRIGAVVSCASCGQAFRVAEAHMTRRAGASPASQASSTSLLAGEGGGSNPAGLGATEAGAGADQAPVQGEPVQAEPITSAPAGGVETLAERRRFWLYLAAGLGTLVALVAILWLAAGGGPEADTAPPDGAGAAETFGALHASDPGAAPDARFYHWPAAPAVGAWRRSATPVTPCSFRFAPIADSRAFRG